MRISIDSSGTGLVMQAWDGNMLVWTWAAHIDGPEPGEMPPEVGVAAVKRLMELATAAVQGKPFSII